MIDASTGQRTANTLSRRHVLRALGVYAGTLAMGADVALGQAPQGVAPPSTVTVPPRDFGPGGAPTTYFWDPDVIAVDPTFNSLAQPNAPDTAAVDRRALVRGAGVERPRPISGLERHPQQPAATVARG